MRSALTHIARVSLIVLLVGVFVSGVLLLTRIYQTLRLPALPIYLEVIDRGIDFQVCPGQIAYTVVEIDILEPTTLDIVVTTMYGNGIQNIPGLQREYMPRPHPRRGTFRQTVQWEVPTLSPGNYLQVGAYHSHHSDAQVVFWEVPYTIGENCYE